MRFFFLFPMLVIRRKHLFLFLYRAQNLPALLFLSTFHSIVSYCIKGPLRITFHTFVSLVSCALQGQLLRQYVAHAKSYMSFDCFFGIQRTLRITFYSVVSYCIQALTIMFIRLFLQHLAHTQDYISFDCFVRTLRTLRITFNSIVSLESRAHLRLPISRLFRQDLAYLKDLVSRLYLGLFLSVKNTSAWS